MSTNRQGAIVVSWAAAVPGRESKMIEVLVTALKYVTHLRETGRVEDARVFVPKVGAFRDTLMLFGKLDSLMSILMEAEFEGLIVDGTVVVQDLRVDLWEGGPPEWLLTG